jgi:hypothetical protein
LYTDYEKWRDFKHNAEIFDDSERREASQPEIFAVEDVMQFAI